MIIDKSDSKNLIIELIDLIDNTKKQVVSQVNSSMTLLFWNVGNRILTHNLKHQRAEYGKQIVVTVSRELVAKYGRNYEEKNLRRMIQFAEIYSDFENVVTLSRHLSWSHFLTLIPLESEKKRNFYSSIVSDKLISVRELRELISKKTFERTEKSNIQLYDSNIAEGTFKDPYMLDF